MQKQEQEKQLRTTNKYKTVNIISLIVCIASIVVIGMLVHKIIMDDREETLYTFSQNTESGTYADEKASADDEDTEADASSLTEEISEPVSQALPDNYVGEYPVGTPVKYSEEEIRTILEELAETDDRFEEICRQEDQYPESLLNNLCNNPNMIDYALGYPEHYGTVSGTLEESELEADIPLFIQWDKRWGYAAYGNDAVGLSGCGPTCLSMVIVGLTKNENATPDVLAAYAMDNNYYESGSGTKWSFMTEAGEAFGVKSSYLSLQKELIFEELAEGHPIICSMDAGDFTALGHFIVLVGTEDGKIRVHDPNSVERSTKLWDYDTLKSQISSLWMFVRTDDL